MPTEKQNNSSAQRDPNDQRQFTASSTSSSNQQTDRNNANAQETAPQNTREAERSTSQTERQRDVPVSREGRRGETSLARPQGMFPEIFSTPGALAGAFMANPFEFMHRISEEMDSWFENFGLSQGSQPRRALRERAWNRRLGRSRMTMWVPQIEAFQRGNELVVRADVPGVAKEDLDVRVEDGTLIISGERRQEQEEQQEDIYRSERSYGSFHRSIPLPEGVAEEQIAATCRDGVLEVTVPLPQSIEQPRGRKIDIR
jgi:HSP20 family protein